MIYLDHSKVVDTRQSVAPMARSMSGYGGKVATTFEIKLDDNRWRRVYAIQYSNAGSAYILVKGERVWLGSFEPSCHRAKDKDGKEVLTFRIKRAISLCTISEVRMCILSHMARF